MTNCAVNVAESDTAGNEPPTEPIEPAVNPFEVLTTSNESPGAITVVCLSVTTVTPVPTLTEPVVCRMSWFAVPRMSM